MHHAPDGSINSRFDYTYDALGQRTGMTTLDGQWTYTYDLTGQLIHAVFASTNPSIPNQDLSYEYDALGNRVRTIINGITTNYTTNTLNQYTTVGDTTNRYDRDGNLIEETGPDGTRRYTYDALNRLVQVVTPQGTWNYEYDAFGNRTAVVANGERTEYLLDPTGLVNVVGEYDGSATGSRPTRTDLGWKRRADREAGRTTTSTPSARRRASAMPAGAYCESLRLRSVRGNAPRVQSRSPIHSSIVGCIGVDQRRQRLCVHAGSVLLHRDPVGSLSEDPFGLAGGDFNLYRYASNDPSESGSTLSDCWRLPSRTRVLTAQGLEEHSSWIPSRAGLSNDHPDTLCKNPEGQISHDMRWNMAR